jgi:CBS domain-containing protein
MVYATEDLFQRLPIHWMWWPAIGGLAVGLGGLVEPHALGVGYDIIGALLGGDLTEAAVIRLAIVKALIWSIALGSGTSGGVLAPLLIMGGAIGALFGAVVPFGDPGLWALVGMAAIMGGTMRSPLTAIIFAVELTHNFGALLPLATACAVAHATTVLLLRRSILTEKVARRGHHVMREYIVDPFETIRVAEVMARPVDTLPAALPVQEAVAFFTAPEPPPHRSYPVVDEAGLFLGMVTRADVLHWVREGWIKQQTLGEAVAPDGGIVGYEDELAGELADRMAESDTGRAPILRRSDDAVIGLVARRDLLRVRATAVGHEREREALIRLGRRTDAAN